MKLSSTPQTPPEVGATLQKMRLERNLTLEDLSRAAGVSKSMLSQIEREKANPTIAVAWRLANALGLERFGNVVAVADVAGEPCARGVVVGMFGQ